MFKPLRPYFAELRLVRASGGATDERSLYVPLANLLNAVGGTLKPKVFCVQELANQGAGHPDFGLYSTRQVQKGRPKTGQKPERGVVEVKPVGDDAWLTAAGDQVSRYWDGYRRVLVTNARDFVLMGQDAAGEPVRLETFRIAGSEAEFYGRLEKPRAFANEVGAGWRRATVSTLVGRDRIGRTSGSASRSPVTRAQRCPRVGLANNCGWL